jgi:ribose transport system substrate-binding protein
MVPAVLGLILAAGSLIILFFTRAPARQGIRVTAVIKAIINDSEFWEVVKTGMRAAADDFGVALDIQGPWAESDVDGQIQIVEEILANNPPQALILAASDYVRLAPLVERAAASGIRVIALDSGVDSSRPLALVATNNREAGEKAAARMLALWEARGVPPENRQAAIINHVRGASTAMEREAGVREVLYAGNGASVAGSWFTDNFEQNAYAITVQLLSDYPHLAGILAMNEVSTVGAAKALKDQGRGGDIPLVGFDSSLTEIKFIEEGIIAATVIQKPFNMGYLAVRAARDAAENKVLPEFIDTGSVLIDAGNLYDPQNEKLLFPFIE